MVLNKLYLSIALLIITAISFNSCTTDQVDSALQNDQQVEGSVVNENNSDEMIEPTRISKPKWRKIAEFEGEKNQRTSPIKLNGKEWKIKWNVTDKGNKNGEFLIMLQNKHDEEDTEIITQDIGGGESFELFVEDEEGREFYLDITAKQPYKIEIEEYN